MEFSIRPTESVTPPVSPVTPDKRKREREREEERTDFAEAIESATPTTPAHHHDPEDVPVSPPDEDEAGGRLDVTA